MSGKLTSLSAGYAVCGALESALKDMVTAVYPVWATDEDAKLPYVVYYRGGSQITPVKEPVGLSQYSPSGADGCTITVQVYDSDYDRGMEIIEAAREAIEGKKIHYTDDDDPARELTIGCSKITDSSEDWDSGIYLQQISVTCRIW